MSIATRWPPAECPEIVMRSVAVEARRVPVHPGDGGWALTDQLVQVHGGHQRVVDHDDGDASGQERAGDEREIDLVEPVPVAAVDEDGAGLGAGAGGQEPAGALAGWAPGRAVKPGGQLAPRRLALARVARQPHLGVGNLFTVVVLAIERFPVVAAKDEGHGAALLEELGQLGSYVPPCLLSGVGIPGDGRALPKAPSRLTYGWKWSQDAGELKIAGRAAIHVRAIEECESDAIEAVVRRRVDRDRRVLARALEDFREADARSGWGPVIQLAGVDPHGSRDALTFRVREVAGGIEGHECTKGRLAGRHEGLLRPDGRGSHRQDASVREAHQSHAPGVDPGMRGDEAERAVSVGNPLDARQRPRVGADFGQAAPAEAVDDERGIPPLTKKRAPPQFRSPDAAAAMGEDDGGKRPGSGREPQLSRDHDGGTEHEAELIPAPNQASGAGEPEIAGVRLGERGLHIAQRRRTACEREDHESEPQEPARSRLASEDRHAFFLRRSIRSSTRTISAPSRTISRSPAWPQRSTPFLSTMNVERKATLRSRSSTPYAAIVVRWTSLRSGKGNLRASRNLVWQNGLSPLTPNSTAPRSCTCLATSPRPESSGVQMPPQS